MFEFCFFFIEIVFFCNILQKNLSIVFGPTLMRSINPDPVLALKNTHKEQKVTELLIANYLSIFDK